MYEAGATFLAAGGPGKADFGLLAPHFTTDVVLYQADALPYGGVWRGHAGIEGNMLAMAETWEQFDFTDQRFLVTGETTVVLTQVRTRARATGRELTFPILQTITLDHGQITEVRPFYWDTNAIADACGTSGGA
ncbi:nuclear transport factor 2 family protein [Phytoactinopolyspora limicola]|uniref:nuclear transport factor 2 family protein n=1 Tax=Phytoactinopolyspora limicola TaxID=2715536 RepID=UPI00140D4105|nr:nuclear transport factor 2 family protein [Phytoactinopolyspora limicola]